MPEAKSRASKIPTLSPLVTASKADPAPTTPAPITNTSSSALDISCKALLRAAGLRAGATTVMINTLAVGERRHNLPRSTMSNCTRLTLMPGPVQSVERAAAMLQLLASQDEPLALAQVSSALGLAKGTAHGLLRTLAEVGFVVHDPSSGRYEVAPGLFRLGASALDVNELRARALNWTDVLSARTGEAADVAVFRDGRAMRIHHVLGAHDVPGSRAIVMDAHIPLHANALGKVLLAFDPSAGRSLMHAAALPAVTHQTTTDRVQLFKELAQIRDHGWSSEVHEHVLGQAGIAAPIRDRGGFVVASVGIEGPTMRLADENGRAKPALVIEVQKAARSISRELGHGRSD